MIKHRNATPQVAVGTSLAAMVVLSGIALIAHWYFSGLGQAPLAILAVIVGGLVGTRVGAAVLRHLTVRKLLLAFAVLVMVMSLRLMLSALGVGVSAGLLVNEAATTPPFIAYLAVGAASGVLSGIFGIGGGGMVLLMFAVLFGMPVEDGLPMALAVNVANALAGAADHARHGRVLWADVRTMLSLALLGIAVGTWLAIRLPADGLQLIFGLFFAINAVLLARRGLVSK